MNTPRYIPALAYRPLTGVYDPVVRLTTRETTFKSALLQQADLQAGYRALDLGCGTATLTIQAKLLQPGCDIIGLDGDPEILKIALSKARAQGLDIRLDQAMSDRLPYADGSFDRVLSSLFFHHLDTATKHSTLREVHRVLKQGGELHIADWGKAANPLMRGLFYGIQLLDGFVTTVDNVSGKLLQYLQDCGFSEVSETRRFSTIFGTLSLYKAVRLPAAADG